MILKENETEKISTEFGEGSLDLDQDCCNYQNVHRHRKYSIGSEPSTFVISRNHSQNALSPSSILTLKSSATDLVDNISVREAKNIPKSEECCLHYGKHESELNTVLKNEFNRSSKSSNLQAKKTMESHQILVQDSLKFSNLEIDKNRESPEFNVAESQGSIPEEDSISKSSPLCVNATAKPSLAPSPEFGIKARSQAVMSDLEDKYFRSKSTVVKERSRKTESVEISSSHNLSASISKQSRTTVSRANSNPPTPPIRIRMLPHPKTNPRQSSTKRKVTPSGCRLEMLDLRCSSKKKSDPTKSGNSSSIPSLVPIPIPPMSIPTTLQLELSSTGPSPLHIYRSSNTEYPYESSRIKFQRLLNFIILPPHLEKVLLFGSFACLDAWLHTFTILPLRVLRALGVLSRWWGQVLMREIYFISDFIYHGSARMWNRRLDRQTPSHSNTDINLNQPVSSTFLSNSYVNQTPEKVEDQQRHHENLKETNERRSRQGRGRRQYLKLQPSSLSSRNKADLLQGSLIVLSCIILMKLDASRMYHYIRGQAAIKLYVIFNVLEVGDKLLAALGQDIFECLFSDEILDPEDTKRKLIQPLWMFLLALVYNVTHAAALFFQVITLNVAVNSYSNALFTLLMSNQFVEIKSTVFKRIEKDNLFQLTCADVVERFQLCIILLIIALRNIVEMGGLSLPSGEMKGEGGLLKGATASPRDNSVLPNSFSLLPSWSGEILSPFFFVLGSELLVDWIKHSYISKFNNVKPTIYGRYLDILTKDYYSNAFINQNLVKRLGLPVIPLACLFIRSSMQTYHMFLATYLPPPKPSSATELTVESATTSPATTAALEHFDTIIRHALGRSTYGVPDPSASKFWYVPRTDDVIAALTMVVFFLVAFLVLLAFKLVLGMILLRFARNRYQGMRMREHKCYDTYGKRTGAWGMTEVDDEKKNWIYQDDQEKLEKLKEKQKAAKEKSAATQDFNKISRYEMLKRIW